MKREHLRKVLVKAENPINSYEAYFHQFTNVGEWHHVRVIVENEKGLISIIDYNNIQFIS